jgi:hypothetical protein
MEIKKGGFRKEFDFSYMATTAILDLFTTPTADTHYSGYSYKVS